MAGSNDFTGQNIQDTYQRVLQLSSSGQLADGTGSLVPLLDVTASFAVSASHEITKEVTSSYAETASAAENDFNIANNLNFDGTLPDITANGTTMMTLQSTVPQVIFPTTIRLGDTKDLRFGVNADYKLKHNSSQTLTVIEGNSPGNIRYTFGVGGHLTASSGVNVELLDGQFVSSTAGANLVQVTSSVVSASDHIQTNTLKGGGDDVSLHVIGSITASGDISSSGDATFVSVLVDDDFAIGSVAGVSRIKGNSSNDFRFLNHNNSEKMRLLSDGKLGIGNTNPPEVLTVEGNISASGDGIFNNLDIDGNIQLDNNAVIYSEFTNRGRIDLFSSNTEEALQVQLQGGTTELNIRRNTGVEIIGDVTASANISSSKTLLAREIFIASSASSGGHMSASGNIVVSGTGSFSDGRFTGKVGIGTNAPSAFLHLEDANSPTFRIKDTTNNATFQAAAIDSSVYIGATSNHGFNLRTNNSNRVTITADGKVGIGNQTPPEVLTVEGNISASGDIILNDNSRLLVNTASVTQAGLANNIVDGVHTAFFGSGSSNTSVMIYSDTGHSDLQIRSNANSNAQLKFNEDGSARYILGHKGVDDAFYLRNDASMTGGDQLFKFNFDGSGVILGNTGSDGLAGAFHTTASANLKIFGSTEALSHVSASGNISASGTVIGITGSFGRGNFDDVVLAQDILKLNTNNKFIQAKETGGTSRNILGINDSDIVHVANANLETDIKGTSITLSATTTASGDFFVNGQITASAAEAGSVAGGFTVRPNLHFYCVNTVADVSTNNNTTEEDIRPGSASQDGTIVSWGAVTSSHASTVFDLSSNELTIKRAGLYKFTHGVTLEIRNGSNRLESQVGLLRKPSGGSYAFVNGTETRGYHRFTAREIAGAGSGPATGATHNFTGLVQVEANDTFKILFAAFNKATTQRLRTIPPGTTWYIEAVT